MTFLHLLGYGCSLLIGISLGLMGGGGSMLTLPVLVYLLGVNPLLSTTYSLFVVGFTSLVGAVRSIGKQQIHYRVALLFSPPSFVGVLLTRRYVLPAIPDQIRITEQFQLTKSVAIMLLFAVIMLLASVLMITGRKEPVRAMPSARFPTYSLLMLTGLVVGGLTGLAGIGGGFLIIPALVLLVRLPMKRAVGTSLLIIAANSLLGFLCNPIERPINWPFLLTFTALAVLGILIGTQLARFISGFRLRKTFGWSVLVISVCILGKEALILPVAGRPAVPPPAGKGGQSLWKAPDLPDTRLPIRADSVRYGRELIARTAYYLGPAGKVARLSNGMNCQNCHLDAGTRPWGNNFGAVAATYPKFRERSGTTETIVKRIRDCFERSLNGHPPDSASREMKAMVAYIRFIGRRVPKGERPNGTGLWTVPFLDRAADPLKGRLIYRRNCATCHGLNGRGVAHAEGREYIYPPLWGDHSYNTGAGLYRLSRLAGYIKANMPLGSRWDAPRLSDEEAWDVAAYINSRPRPHKQFPKDWPNLNGKPVDHPFGPFVDSFPARQHKFGPFGPILASRKHLR